MRHEAVIATQIDSENRKGRFGITRNVSPTGVLFHSVSRLRVGDRLTLTLQTSEEAATTVTGTVVRTESDSPELRTVFPHVAAVLLDQRRDELLSLAL